jgi:uncharacterized protein YndB with AHSA1/START domain
MNPPHPPPSGLRKEDSHDHHQNKKATIEVDTDVPMVRIIREFDAPVHKVFQAHADPMLFAQWNGPRDLTSTIEEFDFRTGGSYRYTMRRDGFEGRFHGSFHDVRTDELIVQTFTFDGMPDGVALEKLRFEDLGNGRTRLVATSLVDRDAFIASGMETGVQEGYERLDALLATG